jgi:ASC-1-like (ASCH) protein
MKKLKMTLKKEWFDKIKSGEKKQEFREVKKHWIQRLTGEGTIIGIDYDYILLYVPKKYDTVLFTNGYSKNSPQIEVEVKNIELRRNITCPLGYGDFFVINLGNVISNLDVRSKNECNK